MERETNPVLTCRFSTFEFGILSGTELTEEEAVVICQMRWPVAQKTGAGKWLSSTEDSV
jgi:hypothetical protein